MRFRALLRKRGLCSTPAKSKLPTPPVGFGTYPSFFLCLWDSACTSNAGIQLGGPVAGSPGHGVLVRQRKCCEHLLSASLWVRGRSVQAVAGVLPRPGSAGFAQGHNPATELEALAPLSAMAFP